MAFTLTCPDFKDGGPIPDQFTGEGGCPPALIWAHPPDGTCSLVLILHDPDSTDAPDAVHWVLFDIPPQPAVLPEDAAPAALPGLNDAGRPDYDPPRPAPDGHRYVFDLYALDIDTLGLERGAAHDAVEAAMEGHLLGRATLAGLVVLGDSS